MWHLERNIHTTAQYVPGVQNTIASAESQTIADQFDWKMNLNFYLRSHRGGTICHQTNSSVPILFQLATRSLCGSDGRLSAGLVKGDKLCESPFGSDR